ncbi:MAG: hypothetical protein ACK4SX_00795 [Alcanivoracaceae bacterium]
MKLLPLCVAAMILALTGCQADLPDADTRSTMFAGKAIVAVPGTPMKLVPQQLPRTEHDGVRVSVVVPRGRVTDAGQLLLLDHQGEPVPARRRVRLHWPTTHSGPHGIRVIELEIAGNPATLFEQTFYLRLVDEAASDAGESLQHPLTAVAMLAPQWHIDAMLFGRGRAISDSTHWFDQSLVGFTHTATNRVPESVKENERIRLDDHEPWLFDRAGVLFQVYFRSGIPWHFAEAEQASRLYANLLDPDGSFRLRRGDLKYVYPRSLLYRWMLFNEEHQAGHITRMARLAESWTADGQSARFWTERHVNYALAAAVHAWELTGEARHRQRIDVLLDDLLQMTQAQAEDGRPYHCPAHRMEAHEGKQSDTLICSPWMMALLGQTLDYYYQLSDDPRAAGLLADFHQYLLTDGLYRVGADSGDVKLRGMLLPWYLAGRDYGFSDNGPFGDLEHSCDVAGLLARSADVRRRLEPLPASHDSTLAALMKSCEFNLRMWHRPGSDSQHGKPVWRLSPPRKYNWWFGTTQELTWFLSAP